MSRRLLAAPVAIVRQAEVPVGAVFWFWGRPLRVETVTGTDPCAPVIVEELSDGPWTPNGPAWLKGQFGLWSHAGVLRAMAGLS